MTRLIGVGALALVLVAALPAVEQAQKLDRGKDLYQAGKYEQAEAVLRELAEEEAGNAQAHYYLGLCRLELKRFSEAEDSFKKADAATPRSEDIKIGLGRAYMEQDQLENARKALEEARSIRPGNAEVYYQFGMLEARRKDFAASAKNLEKVTELEPGRTYAYYYAGIAYSNLKRADKMVQHFQTFLKLAPDAPEAPKVRSLLRTVR